MAGSRTVNVAPFPSPSLTTVTPPPCNAANPCALITDEIRRGCTMLREALKQRPARAAQGIAEPDFCKAWLPE